MMARLCARALEHNIENEYARMLIRRRQLPPPVDSSLSESWPWPVRIYALGRLKLQIEDVPWAGARKLPRKLLELLALLVASGELGVTAERAVEALWPEFDGMKSREAFRVALYRLRRLLGGEDRVLSAEGEPEFGVCAARSLSGPCAGLRPRRFDHHWWHSRAIARDRSTGDSYWRFYDFSLSHCS